MHEVPVLPPYSPPGVAQIWSPTSSSYTVNAALASPHRGPSLATQTTSGSQTPSRAATHSRSDPLSRSPAVLRTPSSMSSRSPPGSLRSPSVSIWSPELQQEIDRMEEIMASFPVSPARRRTPQVHARRRQLRQLDWDVAQI